MDPMGYESVSFYQLPGVVSDYGHPKMKPSTAFCCGKSRAWPVLGVPCEVLAPLGTKWMGAATPSPLTPEGPEGFQ